VVEETIRPGAPSVAVIALNANQVFNWRKLYHAGRLNDKVPESELRQPFGSSKVERCGSIRAKINSG